MTKAKLDRDAQAMRLVRAGFRHVDVWLPAFAAQRVIYEAETYRDARNAVLDKPIARRPKKHPKESE